MIDLDLLCFVLLCFFRVLGKTSGKRFMTSLTFLQNQRLLFGQSMNWYILWQGLYSRGTKKTIDKRRQIRNIS